MVKIPFKTVKLITDGARLDGRHVPRVGIHPAERDGDVGVGERAFRFHRLSGFSVNFSWDKRGRSNRKRVYISSIAFGVRPRRHVTLLRG